VTAFTVAISSSGTSSSGVRRAVTCAFVPKTRQQIAELGGDMHNTTLRVTVTGEDRLVILRFAPHPERQLRTSAP
jgi:hypothetical protein